MSHLPRAAPAAGPDESQVRELAQHDDWRDRVAALKLPEVEAHELRVACLRERVFAATRSSIARLRGAGGRQRRGR